jgi:hypothetical protein
VFYRAASVSFLCRNHIGALRPVNQVLAMHPYKSLMSAIALASCVAMSFFASAAPVQAVEPMPDAGILSAVPFQFHSDSAIFTQLPETPADSRIFSPRKSLNYGSNSMLSQQRLESQLML